MKEFLKLFGFFLRIECGTFLQVGQRRITVRERSSNRYVKRRVAEEKMTPFETRGKPISSFRLRL